jgi:hypothetical protein
VIWRKITEQDLEKCLAMDQRQMGHELIGKARALKAWKTLIRSSSFASCVIEEEVRGVKRLVGFGASVFVSPAFAERELAQPAPGLNARILQSVDSGHPVVLTAAGLRAGNTRGDLTVAVLAGSWIDGLDPNQLREVQLVMAVSFLEHHKGYQIRRLIYETKSTRDHAYAQAIPGWEMVTSFEKGSPCGLWAMDRKKAGFIPGSVGAILFGFPEAVLGLREPEQEILSSAIRGLTDEEVAAERNLSLAMIKKRWADIFHQVERVKPELILDGDRNGTRGRQKRHRLMAYLREHPEELRPIEPRPRTTKRTLLATR